MRLAELRKGGDDRFQTEARKFRLRLCRKTLGFRFADIVVVEEEAAVRIAFADDLRIDDSECAADIEMAGRIEKAVADGPGTCESRIRKIDRG